MFFRWKKTHENLRAQSPQLQLRPSTHILIPSNRILLPPPRPPVKALTLTANTLKDLDSHWNSASLIEVQFTQLKLTILNNLTHH